MMNQHAEQLTAEVLSLSTTDRAELAHRLIESLDVDEQLDAGGYAEARSRLDDIERGIVEPIPADELFRRVQRRRDAHAATSGCVEGAALTLQRCSRYTSKSSIVVASS
jgi:putative addiction module component (TIGR02574 family)